MKIQPTSEDRILGEGRPTQGYQLPDRTSVVLDVESDSRFTEWSYFWLKFSTGAVRPAWYRVFEKGKEPPKWLPLKSVEQVLRDTDVDYDDDDDEDPEETRRERKGKVGAAEKLPPGLYQLQAKFGRGDGEYELTGVEFPVKPAPPKPAPKPGEVEVSLTRPKCNPAAPASFIKLPKLAVRGLRDVCRMVRLSAGPGSEPHEYYPEYLKLHGRPAVEYPWPGIFVVTLLPYLQEKHQIALMKSEHDKVTLNISEGRKAPQYIFTDAHRQAFLKKLGGKFSEQEMREYFRIYNGTDVADAGKKMLDGVKALRECLSTLDADSVILFSIGFPPEERAFLDAARTGDIKKVRKLLDQGVPVDARDELGIHYLQVRQTALMYAAGGGHLEVVRLLLKAGASVAATDTVRSQDDGGGQTALHYATGRDNVAVVEELLNAGADLNALTIGVHKPGYTPLICALRIGQREIVHLLIQRGANMGSKIGDQPAYSALCAVLEARDIQISAETIRDLFLLLLKSGADPNGVSSSKRTALFQVLIKERDTGHTDLPEPITNLLVEKLLKAGANPDWIDDFGSVPMQTALSYQKVRAVKLLIKAGADVNRVTPQGRALSFLEEDIAKCKKSLSELSPSPPKDEEAAGRWKKVRAVLEEKLRRRMEIRKILRRSGAKRNAGRSRGK